jgi:hypothetical protein
MAKSLVGSYAGVAKSFSILSHLYVGVRPNLSLYMIETASSTTDSALLSSPDGGFGNPVLNSGLLVDTQPIGPQELSLVEATAKLLILIVMWCL